MGFRFRRSVRILPGVRLNLSGSGASVSLGARGFHYTIGPKGTRVTAGLPGTGLSWTQYRAHGTPSERNSSFTPRAEDTPAASPNPQLSDYDPPVTAIQSAPAQTLNALSISELAPILNAAQLRVRWAPIIFVSSMILLALSVGVGNETLISVSIFLALTFVVLSIYLDRYRRSVKIKYELEGTASTVAKTLAETFSDIKTCHAVWNVSAVSTPLSAVVVAPT